MTFHGDNARDRIGRRFPTALIFVGATFERVPDLRVKPDGHDF
jgi:hypothetical protein